MRPALGPGSRSLPAEADQQVRARMAALGWPLYLGEAPGHDGRWEWVCAPPQQAAMVLGPPRSGKTTAVVIPAVLAASGPVLSTSTKPDVLAATASARARRGRCWLFDPSGSVAAPPGLTPLRWSPVPACRDWEAALLMARAMVGAARSTGGSGGGSGAPAAGLLDGGHWAERAEALLAPLLHAAALDGADAATILQWVNRRDAGPALHALSRHPAASSIGRDVLAGIATTASRELSAIWSTTSGVLAAYRSEPVLASAAAPNFDAAAFVSSTDTVYVCSPARYQDLLAPLVVGLVEDIRAATYTRHAARAGAHPPMLLALDEVANIAPLASLPAIVSEGGGQGLLTLACFQDLSQARTRWGESADGFLSLFGTKLVLRGIADLRTLEALSALAGEQDVLVRSETRAPWDLPWRRSRGRSMTLSTRRQRRLAVDAISQGVAGLALLYRGSEPPAWVRLTPWFAHDLWRGVVRELEPPTLGRGL